MSLLKYVQCTRLRSGSVEIKRDAYLEQLKIRKDNNGNQAMWQIISVICTI